MVNSKQQGSGNAVASWSKLLINFSSHGLNPRGHFERIAVSRIQILCIEAMLESDQCYDIDDHSGDVQPWELVIQFWCMLMVVEHYDFALE